MASPKEKELFQKFVEDFETLREANRQISKSELAGYLADRMAQVTRIKNEVSSIGLRRSEIDRQFRTNLKRLDVELEEIQNKCPHLLTTYFSDPSGGGDSETTCDHCKKSLRS